MDQQQAACLVAGYSVFLACLCFDKTQACSSPPDSHWQVNNSSGCSAHMPPSKHICKPGVCPLILMQGFESHWYSSNRVLQVFDGTRSADPQVLLKQVPQQPGLHLWLVKPPCSRCVLARGTWSTASG